MSLLNKAFEENISSIIAGPIHDRLSSAPMFIGKEFDDLANAQSEWSFLKKTNFYLMRSIVPTKLAAIVTSVKNEGIYLIEWLAHYRALGFEGFFLYTNDNDDGSDDLLHLLHKHGVIRLIVNEFDKAVSPQVKAFEHSIHLLRDLRAFEWVAYLDADEFLVPSEHYDFSILNLLRTASTKYANRKPSAICFNWSWYGSSGRITREDGLVQEQFFHRNAHDHVKSIVRLPDITTMWPVHIPDPGQVFFVNSDLFPVSMFNVIISPPEYAGGRINHYFHKSFEEYALKINRNIDVLGYSDGRKFTEFFAWDLKEGVGKSVRPHELLLARTKDHMRALMELEGVRASVEAIEKTRRAKALSLLDGDILQGYETMKSKFLRETSNA